MIWERPRLKISFIQSIILISCSMCLINCMSKQEIETLRDEVKDMFYHGYNSYMSRAYPADEFMLLSCRGRYRTPETNSADIDDALGNFSLTLGDTLDTLVIFNNISEFESGVSVQTGDLSFDTDVVVSVFETNMRVLRGLIKGHIFDNYIKDRYNERFQLDKNELLLLAQDLGYRLLPAINTSTGIPHSRVCILINGRIIKKDSICEFKFFELLIESLMLFVIFVASIVISSWFLIRKRNRATLQHFKSVGKISFDPKNIIGYGSSGTFVYKGYFENRQQIAVKRVIIDFFTLAEREIELLRTFQHQNLIRYFATESDELFKYIGIELADFSLADYIEETVGHEVLLDPIDILHQSSMGLEHLHALNIVHRDIKPQNILISMPLLPSQKRKIMISDFGVSKQIASKASMSGDFVRTTRIVRGTDGWIAPEILQAKFDKESNGHVKFAKPVDIFSFGCLFYYVLSKGKHPFGESIERQANILKGRFTLEAVSEEENLIKSNLIEAMIAPKATDRPSIEAVIKHPLFWTTARQLAFFQDVSDRLEKASLDSDAVKSLEKGGFDVVKGDWRRHITEDLQKDLNKFRSYRGSSVRDLLRSLRNKKHHYRELNPSLQNSLGSIPNEFVEYFTSRFPRLLIHSYISMQAFREEHIFKDYYAPSTSFPPLPRTWKRYFESKPKNGKISSSPEDNLPSENVPINGGTILPTSDINDNNDPSESENWRTAKANPDSDPSNKFFLDPKIHRDKLIQPQPNSPLHQSHQPERLLKGHF